ncbi:hypothetical protein G6F68_019929 [Rhizopus microsporus]|nr:hypothetical protein G6F68_019929 [Rhizopus microsporus]
MPMVGRPRAADKWVRPLSRPTIRREPASRRATELSSMRGITSAPSMPATSRPARWASDSFPASSFKVQPASRNRRKTARQSSSGHNFSSRLAEGMITA